MTDNNDTDPNTVTKLEFPNFQRRTGPKSASICSGYDQNAVELVAKISAKLAQMPEAIRAVATLEGPDDGNDAWYLLWYETETDQEYTERWHQHDSAQHSKDWKSP